MTIVLEIKEKLKLIYAEYAYAINMVLKFLLALMVFMSINKKIGYLDMLTNIYPVLFFALLCSLLSVKSTAVFAGIMILGHSYALGLEVMGVTAVVMIILVLFFLRFDETDCLGLLLTPLSLAVGVPVFIPICFGLKGKPSAAFSIGCGAVSYYYVGMLSEKASVLQHTETADMINNLRVLVDGMLQNRLMFLTTAALVLVAIIVYCVRRIALDYIWHIAIGTGVVVYLVVMVSGGLFMDIDFAVVKLIIGTLVSGILALVMEFFVLNVDYSRTERMEFEDDEYYYYVKAVPKVSITQSQREIKTIVAETEENPVKAAVESVMHKFERLKNETEKDVVTEEEIQENSFEEEAMDVESIPAFEPITDEEVIPEFEKKLEESLNDL